MSNLPVRLTPDTRKMLRSVKATGLLEPVVRATLYDPKFEGFDVAVRPWTGREPDFWFHPSTHPLWTERQLFYWMTDPHRLVAERMELSGVLAVTVGSFWHEFVQRLLYDNGVLTRAEVPLSDPETRSRGHMDGLLATFEGFEFKTGHPSIVDKIKDAESLLAKKPEYYAQAQEYLRMSNLQRMRFLFMSTVYPFTMSEFTVDYDPGVAEAIERKYRNVLAAVEAKQVPQPCCALKSKQARSCPARTICPIGIAS